MRLAPSFAVLLTVALSATTALAAGSLEAVVAQLRAGREPVRIVAFGDSITGVYYHTGGRRAWCDLLGIALKRVYPQARLEMINAGISGNTSAAGLARMDRDVLARHPHLVVVMFGMNDAAGAPIEQFAANLRTIIGRCRQARAAVVLCTPNNVYPNPRRPIERLAQFAQTVRDVAREQQVPLADCYRAYDDVLRRDPLTWALLMSETIHPSMNGHKLFAEVLAETISGQRVTLADVFAPPDTLRFTLARLRAGKPISLIAMPPYDRLLPAVLRGQFPAAQINATTWPTAGRSLADLEQWARQIRKQTPHLVVVAVPADASAANDEAYLRSYAWILNWSIDFGLARWDRLAILPAVTTPLAADQQGRQALAERVIRGADCDYLGRQAGDARTAQEVLRQWLLGQIRQTP
jgi:lysophospholipase L1-like esterase